MKKRPEEKEVLSVRMGADETGFINFGYNTACGDWEKFLPSIGELEEIIKKSGLPIETIGGVELEIKTLAETLAKRIGGKGDG